MRPGSFEAELESRLDEIRRQGLYRELRPVDSGQSPRVRTGSRELVNFSSNDYLGLARHPRLVEAATRAARDYGAGAGASRLISGSLAPCHALDEALAAFKGAEAALSFSSGYLAALGAMTALLDSTDVVILDRLVHASMVDAARLSGAKLLVFAHNDLNKLQSALRQASARISRGEGGATLGHRCPRILIVTESVFSMDGDQASLKEIVGLKEEFGAWLMVDEAHATGLFGARRRGLIEACGLEGQVEIQLGTLGKAAGAAGGYVCGPRRLIDYLINRARSFIFSTAPVPAAAAAAAAGIAVIDSPEGAELNRQLWDNTERMARGLAESGNSPKLPAARPPSPILPIMIGDEVRTVEAAVRLRELGVWVPAIRYPAVGRNKARLRLTVSAAHTREDLAIFFSAFQQSGLGTPSPA